MQHSIPTLTTTVLLALASPAIAHTTIVAGDVAGTWHIDPNHNPKAGEPARIWIALTRQGGSSISLDQCACQLLIYSLPNNQQPSLTPQLQSITAERYQGIPGTEVIFPKPGAYRLRLQGKPKQAGDFSAFTLDYTVTVGAGSAKPSPPTDPHAASPSIALPQAQPSQPQPPQPQPPQPRKATEPSLGKVLSSLALPIVLVTSLGILLLITAWRRR